MKILCPTDISNEANNGVAYAAKLAQKIGSTLVLLNVQLLAELTPEEALFGQEANIKNAQDVLDRRSDEISRTFKIDCRAIVRSSVASLTAIIRDEAKAYDLIVMGTDGPDTLIESMIGSKTYQTAAKSELPILIIPNDAGYSEIARILFAFDYRRIASVPMRQVASIAGLTGAEIIMLQIVEERWTHQIEKEIQSAQTRVRQAWPGEVPLRFETVYADDHVESLADYITSFNADVVAIGYHKVGLRERIFNKSKTRQIVAGASYPLLIVHS